MEMQDLSLLGFGPVFRGIDGSSFVLVRRGVYVLLILDATTCKPTTKAAYFNQTTKGKYQNALASPSRYFFAGISCVAPASSRSVGSRRRRKVRHPARGECEPRRNRRGQERQHLCDDLQSHRASRHARSVDRVRPARTVGASGERPRFESRASRFGLPPDNRCIAGARFRCRESSQCESGEWTCGCLCHGYWVLGSERSYLRQER